MKNEPVLTIGVIAGAVVTLASLFHVALNLSTVETILTAVVPVVAAFLARRKVTPAA